MRPIKTTCLCILATLLLSACQLFEPLPTLPPVLTLPPVDLQASPQAAQATLASSLVPQASANPAAAAPTLTPSRGAARLPHQRTAHPDAHLAAIRHQPPDESAASHCG